MKGNQKMSKARKHTIYVPDSMSDKLEKAYYALLNIDCNLSRLVQCLLVSIVSTAKFIHKHKKNFRHYNWGLIIQDKETDEYHSNIKGFNK